MIDVLLKSTLVIALAAIAAFVLRRQPPGLVHRVWMAGLIAALVVPALSLLLPQWPLAGDGLLDWRVGMRPGIADTLLAVWIAGAVVGLGIMLAAAGRLAWLAKDAEPLTSPRWNAALEETRRRLGIAREVHLLCSPHARFLGTWGIVHPRVMLPAAAESWSEARIRMVLAHELAHVARGDWPVQILADAARAIYWFNPLFWILSRRLRRESEHAADNAALGLGIDRADYAEALLEISRFLEEKPGSHAPVLAVAQPSFLERRLVAVLDPGLRRIGAAPWATLAIVGLAVALTLPLAALRRDTSVPAAAVAEPADAADVGGPAEVADMAGPTDVADMAGAAGVADTAGAAGVAGTVDASCPMTPTIEAVPPDPSLAPLGTGPWHVNADRTIWVWDQPYVANMTVASMWIRPEGRQLAIEAERLDAEAPPAETRFTCCHDVGFKTGGLRFPSPGCWRVTARAGDSELIFVTRVRENPRGGVR